MTDPKKLLQDLADKAGAAAHPNQTGGIPNDLTAANTQSKTQTTGQLVKTPGSPGYIPPTSK